MMSKEQRILKLSKVCCSMAEARRLEIQTHDLSDNELRKHIKRWGWKKKNGNNIFLNM